MCCRIRGPWSPEKVARCRQPISCGEMVGAWRAWWRGSEFQLAGLVQELRCSEACGSGAKAAE